MKHVPLILILILTSALSYSQNLVGYNEKQIVDYMKANCKGMSCENVSNKNYKYLKYTNSYNTQTILFFLNDNSVCKTERLICDYTEKIEKVKEYDKSYRKTGENSWIDSHDGTDYLVELKNEEWSFVFTISKVN